MPPSKAPCVWVLDQNSDGAPRACLQRGGSAVLTNRKETKGEDSLQHKSERGGSGMKATAWEIHSGGWGLTSRGCQADHMCGNGCCLPCWARGGEELSAKMLMRWLAPPKALLLGNSTALPCSKAVPYPKGCSALHAAQDLCIEASVSGRGAGQAVLGSSRNKLRASTQQEGGREAAAVT